MTEQEAAPNYSIHELSSDELPAVLDLNRRIVEESSNLDYADPDKLVTDYLDAEQGKVLVVSDDSKIIGMQGYKPSQVDVFGEGMKDVIKINLLRVDPEQRGKGIASELIQSVEAIALEHGIPEVHLSVEETGPTALYEKLGYSKYRRADGKGAWDETRQGRVLSSTNGQEMLVFDYRKILAS